jgi:hypothetical protein
LTLQTKVVLISGELDAWQNHSGCNVNINAALTLRID